MSDGNGKIPEFKADYVKAFVALMLFKLGGSETITLELLEKFPEKECPQVIWEPKLKAFTLKSPRKRRRGILKPKRKLILPN